MKKLTKGAGMNAGILALLGEGAKTRVELAGALGRPAGNVGVALAHLKKAGKVSSERTGSSPRRGITHRYRLHGPAVSPIKEGPVDEPEPKKARKPRAWNGKPTKIRVGRLPSSADLAHPVLGPLYEQRDRLDRAIAILEGRE